MTSIAIRNVGPISDTGPIKLSRFNVIIGRQSTGKSTIMKILCFCQWIEKKIVMRDDQDVMYTYTHYSRFLKELMQFHRLNANFFNEKSEIHYSGEFVKIDLVGNKNVKINLHSGKSGNYHNTKLCFIPSERNLVSVIKNIDRTYKSNEFDVLFNHIYEWGDMKRYYHKEHPVRLSVVGNMEYYYDGRSDSDIIKIDDGQKIIDPFFASSGVQSVLPLVVMTDYLTGLVFENEYSPLTNFRFRRFMMDIDAEQKTQTTASRFRKFIAELAQKEQLTTMDAALKVFAQYYGPKNTRIFIEEPEQNLFPESQQALIEFICGAINEATSKTGFASSVSITTHSPYVITALNVLIKAHEAEKIDAEKTSHIVPQGAAISIDDVSAYYICEDGLLADIVDREVGMIGGVELDYASEMVEKKLSSLDDVIYGSL